MAAAPELFAIPEASQLVQGGLFFSGTKLGYWPIEISGLHLSVYTDTELKPNDELLFVDGRSVSVKLVVKKIHVLPSSRLFALQLASQDKNVNLEKMMRDIPELQNFSFYYPSSDDRINGRFPVRAARFTPKEHLQIQARTFGTRGDYVLEADNVSKSGMLLAELDGQKTPFMMNTIIEVTIDPFHKEWEHPIRCLGKIVRSVPNESNRGLVKFGIRLIDMEDEANSKWNKYVEKIERSTDTD